MNMPGRSSHRLLGDSFQFCPFCWSVMAIDRRKSEQEDGKVCSALEFETRKKKGGLSTKTGKLLCAADQQTRALEHQV
jgi:hypothetical protein